jgi:prepilin-type N-terminal cleavage/methylation domain-containing protein
VRRPRQAFTLFELLLVLALLTVLAAVAYPSLDAMYGNFRVTAAADMVRAAWAQARAHAMNDGYAYRFSVVPGRGNYRVAPDVADFWGGNGAPASALDPDNPPFVYEDVLPRSVRFRTAKGGVETDLAGGGDSSSPVGSVDPGSWTTIATFLPDGTAREDVELVFQARGARALALKLRGLTGVVTTRPLAAAGGRP